MGWLGSHICPVLVLLFATGCVERTLTVQTDPPGSLLYLNGIEVGRTPVRRDFTWYGKYEVVVRKDGYETLKTGAPVNPPWWQWIPIDFVTELLPFTLHDQQHLSFSLRP